MMCPEKNLWCAVINQALLDATSRTGSADRLRAIDWLTKPNRDFVLTCNLAGYEHDFIRKKALAFIEKHEAEQAGGINGRASHYEYNGKRQSLNDWAKETGIPVATLQDRIRRGWSFEDAITSAVIGSNSKQFKFQGRSKTLTEWANEYGLPYTVVYARLRGEWSLEAALTTPYEKGRKPRRSGRGVANFGQRAPDRMSPTAQEST